MKYRCACCEKLKKESRWSYWVPFSKQEKTPTEVCFECFEGIKRAKLKFIEKALTKKKEFNL